MGKTRQIFVWDGAHDLGPFRRDELVERLKLGAILPSHYYYEEGMTDWARVASLPCCTRFLASDAQKQMLARIGVEYDEYLTKDDISMILEQQPSTERQLALISYLGLAVSDGLTKKRASEIIAAAKRNPALGARFDSWNVDRFELHPDLYAAEQKSFKQGRAEILLKQYREFRSGLSGVGVKVKSLTIQEIEGLIAHLDSIQPDWDRDIQLDGVDHVLKLLGDSISGR